MNIQADRFYRTRDGRKAYISVIDKRCMYPVRGIILGEDFTLSWTLSGDLVLSGRKETRDIVAEWGEE